MPIEEKDIKFTTPRDAFESVRLGRSNGSWLYLVEPPTKSDLDSECFFHDGPEDDDDGEGKLMIRGRWFSPHLDSDSIEGCVKWADRLAGKRNDLARLEIFRYYFRFDSFPERLGAPDPPPPEESMRIQDLKWYDELGPENQAKRCKRENCDRGVVRFSAFCRPHHFEMMLKRPCPFTH
jgi:hypothetical protein